MTYIKICGIKNEADALATATAGADFIGLVFALSLRQVTPDVAAKITSTLKKNKVKAKSVGVFVNERIETVKTIADDCHLDWVQLSGNESWKYCRDLDRPVIKALKFNNLEPVETIGDQINEGKKIMGKNKYMVLLDTAAKDKYGGTGTPFNWNLVEPIVEKNRVIIAGGLNPENVGEAIKTLKPWAVDVSTGVETNGVKDMQKIIKFIEAVRQADDSQA
ncbi:MAG: phosphoribosylanthranilate isomerase [Dehalococcoidales bacterium]